MIPNQWYVVLESNEVKKGRLTAVTRMGEKMVFWRDASGKAVCTADLCPHLGAQLSQGKLCDGHLACPFHGFEYDSSGQCVYLPAYGRKGAIPKALKARTYYTHESHGLISIFWGQPDEPPAAPQYFPFMDDAGLSCASFHSPWGVHYSRMVENQLDVMHLPFIHYNTIGRGGRTVVDGPLVRLEGGLMELWVYNRLDDGTPPRKAEQIPPPARHAFLQFRFPNIWHNWISDDVHIFVAFVPVDEENCIMYGRFYQRFLRVPGLREIANLFGKWSSIQIANQDQRVVTQQRPKKTDLRMGEKMMQGDRAILTYRTHRKELQEQAGLR